MIKLQNMKPKDTTNITKKIYQKCTFNNVNTLPLKNTLNLARVYFFPSNKTISLFSSTSSFPVFFSSRIRPTCFVNNSNTAFF